MAILFSDVPPQNHHNLNNNIKYKDLLTCQIFNQGDLDMFIYQDQDHNSKDMDIQGILNQAKDGVSDYQGHMVTIHNQDHLVTAKLDLQVTDLQVTDLLEIMDFSTDFGTRTLEAPIEAD